MADEKDTPNTNQTEGRVDQGAGEVKEVAGQKSGDEQLEREGADEQVAGRAQEKLGDQQEETQS